MPVTMMPRRRLLLVAALAVVGPLPASATPARAEPGPTDGAAAFLEGFVERTLAMLSDESLSEIERVGVFRELLSDSFDLDLTARIVLGRHWRQATTEQRRSYRRRFEDYVVAVHGRRLDAYSGETVEVESTRQEGERDAVVRSRLRGGRVPELRVDWRLRRSENGWHIIDVVIEGMSLAITHRSEFATVISREGGIDGLLRKLREKTAEASAGA